MNGRRVLAFTRKTLRQFRHDRRTIGFIVGMPVILIAIFGYTFGGQVKHIPVLVVDDDPAVTVPLPGPGPGPGNLTVQVDFSNQVLDNIDTEILVIHRTTDLAAAQQAVLDGRSYAVIHFPPNYTRSLVAALLKPGGNGTSDAPLSIYLDGSNPTIAGAIVRAVAEGVQGAADDLVQGFGRVSPQAALSPEVSYAYGKKDLRFIDYFAPGVLAFAVFMATMMVTLLHFVGERSGGTLERLLASPATEGEMVVGSSLAFAVLAVGQTTSALLAAILLFQVQITGNVLLAFAILVLIALGQQGLGILLSSAARSEFQAIQFIPLVIFPSILLTGLFWPVESIPAVLQPLSAWMPLTYAIDALRGIMVRGWGIDRVLDDIAVLVVFAVLMLTAARSVLRRRR